MPLEAECIAVQMQSPCSAERTRACSLIKVSTTPPNFTPLNNRKEIIFPQTIACSRPPCEMSATDERARIYEITCPLSFNQISK